jgi:acyl carrier protein
MSEHKETRLTQVTQWIQERRKGQGAFQLDLDTDLIETRIVDSLMVMELLFFLEQLIGRELRPEPQLITSLRTLRTIRDNVL